ncbi:dynein regulatory complex subunit 4-like [Neoarius graeffei]|uniref:dynein regulatory complex subunit 4-like n=1 Tax=Neoarius graeffei TaxID=443677 RepID=UPI00298CCC24|nr:dynein regulatory complex subunit 4-like [Neoarius graeffei]
MEEAEEKHQTEIRVYKHTFKQLMHEQQNTIAEIKAEGVVATKILEKEQTDLESELRRGMRSLKVDLKEQELSNENVIRNLKLNHDKEITKLRNRFEEKVQEIKYNYDTKMDKERQAQDQMRQIEIEEIEERNKNHVSTLIKNHEQAFDELKNHYSDVILKSYNEIYVLKDEVTDLKKDKETLEREKAKVLHHNKKITESLQKTTQEVSEMQKQLTNYEKDKASLAGTRARLSVSDKELKDLKWELKVLEERFITVQQERDELYQKFNTAILEVQQKSGFKNLLLEKKLETLTNSLEKTEAQLNEVLAASNLEPSALNVVTRKLEEVLDSKNTAIKDLQYEVARVSRTYNNLLRTYEAKLKALGLPADEVGFKPLEISIHYLTTIKR